MIHIIVNSTPFSCNCIIPNNRAIPFLTSVRDYFVDWQGFDGDYEKHRERQDEKLIVQIQKL